MITTNMTEITEKSTLPIDPTHSDEGIKEMYD